MTFTYISQTRIVRRALISCAMLVGLAGCYMPTGGALHEGIGYRQARFEEISAVRQYRSCLDQAFGLDSQARAQADPGKYLASATLIEKCEADIGPESASLAVEERFRAYALSAQNRIKGGDIVGARENLKTLKASFPGQDVFLADGSSYLETMELLLGMRGTGGAGEFALLNVNDELKHEMRRQRYWAHH